MHTVKPCKTFHAVIDGMDLLKDYGEKTAFKVYYVSVIGRENPSRTEWAHCGIDKNYLLTALSGTEGVEGIGFVTAFPHISQVYRYAPQNEVVLNMRALNTRDMMDIESGRPDDYVEFACLAGAALAAAEYKSWAETETVEAYLDQWSEYADAPIARHDKLRKYGE